MTDSLKLSRGQWFMMRGLEEFLLMIISGGQTGVDRGALDAAMDAQWPCGGWCPAGRKAEDGSIPPNYPLRELSSLWVTTPEALVPAAVIL